MVELELKMTYLQDLNYIFNGLLIQSNYYSKTNKKGFFTKGKFFAFLIHTILKVSGGTKK